MIYAPPQHHEIATTELLSEPVTGAPLQIALEYLQNNAADFGISASDLDPGDYEVSSEYTDTSNGVTHIHLQQKVNDLLVSQAFINASVGADGEIISLGSSFLPMETTPIIGDTTPSISADEAYIDFAEDLDVTFSETPSVLDSETGDDQTTIISGAGFSNQPVTAELGYAPTEDGLELIWSLDVEIVDQGHWYDAGISAVDGELRVLSDRVRAASYNVFPAPLDSPREGSRALVIDPHDPIASPLGWHDTNGLPGADFFDTRGNNVIAAQDRDGVGQTTLTQTAVTRPNGGPGLNFNFPVDLTQSPDSYTNASVTNLFYLTNVAHDVAFRYGFDEAAGNFQSFNYTGTGIGGDAVVAYAQSGADLAPPTLNNAFFAIAPDGQPGFMVLFEGDTDLGDPNLATFGPRRDYSLMADVIFHEYMHGITNRIVGGKNSVTGLVNLQSLALDEGWADFFGLMLTQQASDQQFDSYPVGEYANGPNPVNPGAGIRRFPYSFDLTVNPLTFGNFNTGTTNGVPNTEAHAAGEIWASALWDMNWLLINKYGFDSDIYDGTGGNNLAMQLVMDGLKLTPANPSYLDARDAILAADLINNQGVNHPEIWQAFARRGMGLSADDDTLDTLGSNADTVSEAFDIPAPISTVTGEVFEDTNGNGTRDAGEPGIAGWEVFVDLNNSGVRDPLEPATTTDANGFYSFQFWTPGTFTIAQTVQGEFTQTAPVAGAGTPVTVLVGGAATADFGLRPRQIATTTGVKFHDLNGDGRREECEVIPGTIQPPCVREPGVPGVWIFLDYDNDTRLDIGEPSAITGPHGEYTITADRNGTFFLREVMTPGWTQTFPGGAAEAHRVTITDFALDNDLDFGNQSNLDFGDAPDIYGTTVAGGGPIYPIIDGFHLGSSVDADLDGAPSTGADGDDGNQATSDEDGVVFSSIISPGSSATVEVTVSSGPYSPGRVNGWMDFNGDGDFADPGEHIIVDTRQGTGTVTYSFPVPDDATAGLTYARFTYGFHRFATGDTPTIRDIAGEVEDYQIRVLGLQPDAIDDQFRVDQNSAANTLNVLDNDVSSRNGPIFISAVGTPNSGGRASISADGLTVSYSPAMGFAGVETLTYTIQDQAGASDTAVVTLTVVPDTPALAVDDSFDVLENTSNNVLDVLSNDLAGQNPPIQILDVVPSTNSSVTVDRRGTTEPEDDVLLYTANPGFAGSDQFSYIIVDEAGVQSTATVTVHNLPSSRNDDIIEYELLTADLTGNSIDAIGVGQPFLLQAYVRDLRADDGDGDPIDRRGIGAAFLDVLYDLSLVSVTGNITFGPDYQNATSGDTTLPGLINEVGALQTGSIPLGADRVMLFEIPMIANAPGAADFRGDPADERAEANPQIPPEHDSLTFQPAEAIPLQGMRFTNASLAIVSGDAVPIAVDNSFSVAADASINNSLDVLANDLDNGNPPLSVMAVTPGSAGGQVAIGPGGSTVLYRPAVGFTGIDQFSYTVQNSTGLTSSAVVTVQVGDNAKSVNYRLATVPAGPIAVGSTFTLQVLVDDLRADDGDGNARDDRGVFAGYIDVLMDSNLVSVVSDATNPLGIDVTFSSDYQNGTSGSASSNLIDEIGAFQTGAIPLGADEQLLFEVTLQANAPGVAEFAADPADISPLHDTLLFEPTDPVALSQIAFGSLSVTITGAAPEGEGLTNPVNNLDVNADGEVSPIDPLIVVNYLNRAAGEGEATSMYVDVTGDGHVSPVDALELINFLNRRGAAEAEGEGGTPLTGPLSSGNAVLRSEAPASSNPPLHNSTAVSPEQASQHESALADWGSDGSNDELDSLLSEDLTKDILDGWGE